MFACQGLPRRVTSRRRRSLAALLECLETRIALSTFTVSSESGLRSAIATADSNGDASNTIDVTSSITLSDGTSGPLEIRNTTTTPKTLTIEAQGSAGSRLKIAATSSLNGRVLELVGTGSSSVSVLVKGLLITGVRRPTAGCWADRRRGAAAF
ncbi:MAG: hypothetical protein ACYC61_25435 [Isosphaeraceae bacterium]